MSGEIKRIISNIAKKIFDNGQEQDSKFVCPKCNNRSIEVVMNGHHSAIVKEIASDGYMDTTEYESEGDIDRFQCENCGYVIKDDDGEIITDVEDLFNQI